MGGGQGMLGEGGNLVIRDAASDLRLCAGFHCTGSRMLSGRTLLADLALASVRAHVRSACWAASQFTLKMLLR